MAPTFTEIKTDDFETWIGGVCPIYEKSPDHTGVYFIPLSETVRLYISTSLGHKRKVIPRGRAACHMKLQSRVTNRTINSQGLGQQRFNRTSGWKENWAAGVEKMISVYAESKGFYDKLAAQTQQEYAEPLIAKIEGVKNWQRFNILQDLHDALTDGKWLTEKQEGAIDKFAAPKGAKKKFVPRKKKVSKVAAAKKKATKKKVAKSKIKRTVVTASSQIEAMKILKKRATEEGDEWLEDFCDSIIQRLQKKQKLTEKQQRVVDRNLISQKIKIAA
jgi:hypothetical protein